MKEVSDKVIVVLVIIAVLVSVIGTYAVTQMAYDVNNFKTNQQEFSPEPSKAAGQVSLLVVDPIEEGDSGG
ncbi:MAG: hypothetical protein ABIJ20_02610 [Nanoarchaeota archaeon]|nr:hypothetical protein [Nanoarchaeota archaeon]MBU1445075.1 hypothetical protein [Nanoarchaeota archaeon]MBU2420737.1 hypothetical protein [Nanoarchaeota archaeon]MBU2475202.1 hypothetical protein [Nanoarchaeota archaeon]